jgi:hypothetical protein
VQKVILHIEEFGRRDELMILCSFMSEELASHEIVINPAITAFGNTVGVLVYSVSIE